MSKRIECTDVGMDCDFAALAEDEDELLDLVAEHVERVHGIDEISPELRQKVLSAAVDVEI